MLPNSIGEEESLVLVLLVLLVLATRSRGLKLDSHWCIVVSQEEFPQRLGSTDYTGNLLRTGTHCCTRNKVPSNWEIRRGLKAEPFVGRLPT
jgi:hypothetical protein